MPGVNKRTIGHEWHSVRGFTSNPDLNDRMRKTLLKFWAARPTRRAAIFLTAGCGFPRGQESRLRPGYFA